MASNEGVIAANEGAIAMVSNVGDIAIALNVEAKETKMRCQIKAALPPN